jgi:hypothetical protein
MTVYRERGARERPGSKRKHIRPIIQVDSSIDVPLKHLRVRQEMVREKHRLGPLQMGISRHNHAGVFDSLLN